MNMKYLVVFLLCSLLQAALARHRYFGSDLRREHYKEIADDIRKYLSNRDPYFGGDNDNNDDQPEISEDDLPKNGELFEGDMVMDDSIRRAVLGLNKKRSAVELALEGHRKHWPDGVVPYVIDESLKPQLVKRVHQAIAEFKQYTCIKYVPKKPSDEDYVIIKDGKGCSSSVGRQGGKQYIHLAGGCERIGTVIHEMMHVIGIVHEQSRSDRDNYIKVRFDHIKPKLFPKFP